MDLAHTLTSLDGRGYGDYKRIVGTHDLGVCRLTVDRVQVDPFAPPSLLRVSVDRARTGIPDDLVADRAGRIAAGDWLARAFAAAARAHAGGGRKSPRRADRDQPPPVAIGTPGQEILERTSVVFPGDRVEARITVDLPASGRRIRGHQAAEILTVTLPRIVEEALLDLGGPVNEPLHGKPLDDDGLRDAVLDDEALGDDGSAGSHGPLARLRSQVVQYRDQLALQEQLASRGLVAFVGDGAILPRRSGDSDHPLDQGAVLFRSPASLRVAFDLPSGRHVEGMGVREGITVIIGGGYHGKSTLLRAMERGVYPHISGDGREWVLTRPDAVAIRAEDGRSTASVDISPFIGNLPSGTDTREFTTANASGSTSQAANLVEALEAGASSLLIDEDTSATNFMIRDSRMRRLIPAHREPITPFVDRVRALHGERGVSTVLVAGGSGAFFDVADHVIALDAYVPEDVTALARDIARAMPAAGGGAAADQSGEPRFFAAAAPRVPAAGALRPADKRKFARARGRDQIQHGRDDIDLSAVLQLVDPAQTQAIAHALERLADAFGDGTTSTIAEAVAALDARLDSDGLEGLSPHRGHPGHLARPRPQEIAAALNRFRGLRIR
ncbi:ABC-ATPase domain-containing protein [Brevibacterium yomogidense]|uniref:ABC-ATPase domain-containing protein n=1 Tax=Brevibacterium yomogidense TaxID=946573 RepID=UPI0018E018D8|nr:ABC-ATPase domain-containing protein [Brevibacterium yomogidense]